jgi:hypothetical protein
MNVQAPTEDKNDDMRARFCEELERVFHNFPKYHTKILLGDFHSQNMGDIFKPTIGNESLHEISNDKLCHIEKSVKSTMFPHRKIHKFTRKSPDGKTIKLNIQFARQRPRNMQLYNGRY